jgi:phosphoglycerol transferase MdoB-like AlkP superfamily enzyme
MRLTGIAFPTRLRIGRRSVGLGGPLFLFVALATLALELALEERRLPIFGRDFRRFHQLDTPLETLLFLAALAAAHVFLLLLVFRALRALHGRKARAPLFHFNFLFVAGVPLVAALAAKFRILSYFSDTITLTVLRNLGGGSLVQAFSYVLDEAMFLFVGIAAAAILYVLLYRLLDLKSAGAQAPPAPLWPRWRSLLLGAPLIGLLLFAAQLAGDCRAALDRFIAPSLLYWGLGEITDFDRDGYSYFSRQRDADPFDSRRHPFALDVPNNGIDEDGFGGDFVYRGGGDALPTPPFPGRKKHVVLIVLESTRADTLTKSWQGRRIAPNLAALAAAGSQAGEAYSHVGFTVYSLKSLFSGRLEPVNDRQSLFRDFKRSGYRVGILSGQAEDFGGIAAAVAMRRYSDVFIDAKALEKERVWPWMRDISILVDARALLREMDRHFGEPEGWRQPTFLYFNVQTAHFPYYFPGTPQFLPGEPIPRSKIGAANRDWVARTYWNGVAYGDWTVGQIVARLKALGVYEDSVVVVLGDHGEELFEHGYLGHGQVLNALQTRIPLIFSTPGLRIPGPVGLTDLRALILDAAGATVPPVPQGRPVFQYIGDLDRPASIAMVESGGRWTRLDLSTEEVEGEGGRGLFRALPASSPLGAKARQLIYMWERERWMQRLSSRS